MTVALPEEVQYGYVAGRFILAVGDSPSDPDSYPNALAPVGNIAFVPTVANFKTNNPPTTVVKQPIRCTLNPAGYLVDPNNELGVWLVVGQYRVTYQLENTTINSHVIDVLPGYTVQNPLDLTAALPPTGPVLTTSQYAELKAQIDALDMGAVDAVNGKVGVVVLSANDVGAYTKTEADAKFLTAAELPPSSVTSVNGETGAVTLTAGEVGAYTKAEADAQFLTAAELPPSSVTSVNGETGAVTLTAGEVGAYTKAEADANFLTAAELPPSSVTSVNGQTGAVNLSAANVGAQTQTQADARYILKADVAVIDQLTQAAYDALTTKDPNTLYLIVG